ncbi:peptidase, M20 with amidohydrolase domain [Desulfosarcina variabilis str. Montpellier]|uniref:M20 metallopeptidase family protein n=1 Tax=Desulfosarcina variabilis TaxID=2300 RepID=UPI003AFAD766
MDVNSMVAGYHDLLVQIRRDLHRIPEVGYTEEKTSAYVAAYLEKEGLLVTTGIARYGVVGLLKSGRPGPTLLIRADMDALPIQEETGHDFASTHSGVMHACGHDAHMAMALVTATVMNKIKDRFCGNIKFVFQPAEEGPGGAAPMIQAGVLENPGVDYALACHIWPTIPEGSIGVRSGAMMAAMFRFDITIKGKGGHGAMPHQCVDALEVGCQVVGALQRIVSRHMDPLNPSVVTVGQFRAGRAFNVIPETATLSGTARTFDRTVWKSWPNRIETVVKGVCESMGAGYDITFEQGYPPTINDGNMSKIVAKAAANLVGPDRVLEPPPSMGGEDMAFFLEKVPGCFFCVGAGNSAFAGIHNPRFDFNEQVMKNGVATFCQAALDLLTQA